MIRILTDDVRLRGVLERSQQAGIDGQAVLRTIGSFETVEKFQVWKNKQSGVMAHVIKRVGGNNYRKLRSLVKGY